MTIPHVRATAQDIKIAKSLFDPGASRLARRDNAVEAKSPASQTRKPDAMGAATRWQG
jgi:hypothetical protein